jgi:hypothetical protein
VTLVVSSLITDASENAGTLIVRDLLWAEGGLDKPFVKLDFFIVPNSDFRHYLFLKFYEPTMNLDTKEFTEKSFPEILEDFLLFWKDITRKASTISAQEIVELYGISPELARDTVNSRILGLSEMINFNAEVDRALLAHSGEGAFELEKRLIAGMADTPETLNDQFEGLLDRISELKQSLCMAKKNGAILNAFRNHLTKAMGAIGPKNTLN